MRRLLLASAFVAAATASAQQQADSSKVNLREAQIVTNRATRQTPIAFSNLSHADIQQANKGQDLPFLLSSLPNVLTTSDAGTGIGYTSLRVRGTDASRINVTINGVPLNDAESHMVYWVNMGDFASSLNSIQLQRGVGTSTNGAAAFGASLNTQTDRTSLRPTASYDGSLGSFGTTKNTFKFGSGLLPSGWAFDGRASYIGSDGYRDRASASLGSYFTQASYFANKTMLKLLAFGGKERTYHAWWGIERKDLLFNRTLNLNGDMGDGKYYENQMDNYFQQHAQALLTHQLSPATTLSAALHYTYGHGYYEQYRLNKKLSKFGFEPYTDASGKKVSKGDFVDQKHLKNHFFGGVASLNYRKGALDFTTGLGLNYYDGDHYGNVLWAKDSHLSVDPTKRYYDGNGAKIDGNLYARANYQLCRAFSLFADLQYRHIDYRITGTSDKGVPSIYANAQTGEFDLHERYNFFNPKFGFTWNLSEAHQLYASWSVAHREPWRANFTESANLVAGKYEAPRAERLFDYEAGYRYTSPRFQAGVNGYWMQYRDQFVLTGRTNDIGEAISTNVKDSYRAGVELSAAWQPAKCFHWDANLSLSSNKIKNFSDVLLDANWDNPIEHQAKQTTIAMSPSAVFNNVFTLRHRGLTASFITQAVSRQYLDNFEFKEHSLEAYCVSHLTLNYAFRPRIREVRELTLGVSIYNLFNEQYETNGNAYTGYADYDAAKHTYRLASNGSYYYPMAGTNFLVNFGVKF